MFNNIDVIEIKRLLIPKTKAIIDHQIVLWGQLVAQHVIGEEAQVPHQGEHLPYLLHVQNRINCRSHRNTTTELHLKAILNPIIHPYAGEYRIMETRYTIYQTIDIITNITTVNSYNCP
jgi:hypothetical protein